MAALYGRLRGGRGEATRTGSDDIYATLETWDGAIFAHLERDGSFRVLIGQKGSANHLIATGNVNDGQRIARVHPMTETEGDASA